MSNNHKKEIQQRHDILLKRFRKIGDLDVLAKGYIEYLFTEMQQHLDRDEYYTAEKVAEKIVYNIGLIHVSRIDFFPDNDDKKQNSNT